MPDIITSAVDVLDKIKSEGKVKVKFVKKDGSDRTMTCTLDFSKIPKIDRPKNVNLSAILKLIKDRKLLHVYDLEKKGWRSIPIDRLDWIRSGSKSYRVKLEKKK